MTVEKSSRLRVYLVSLRDAHKKNYRSGDFFLSEQKKIRMKSVTAVFTSICVTFNSEEGEPLMNLNLLNCYI